MNRGQMYARRMSAWLKRRVKTAEFWLQFAAYAIPLCFLLYVLYINFLPFGYSADYTIQVGAAGDDNAANAFYLQPSPDLSSAMTSASGTTYRLLDGEADVVFNPGVVLKNAQITMSVQSDPAGSVQIIPPTINFDPSTINWAYNWNFATSTPSGLTGNAFHFDNCEYFNGTNGQLQLPNSSNEFKSGPFTVYAEWQPQDSNDDFQEIVGHYDWELLQDKTDVRFLVGRMNNATGPQYQVVYPISDPSTFFNTNHSAVAIYSPSQINGYISLYVDGNLAGVVSIGSDAIWSGYNGNRNLTFGKSDHGVASYFKGSICQVGVQNQVFSTNNSSSTFISSTSTQTVIPLISASTSTLNALVLHVEQN